MALPYANYFFAGSGILSFLGVMNMLTLFGVPILALIMFLSKYVFRTRTSPNFKAGMWAFWLVNIISLFVIGTFQVIQFKDQAVLEDEIDLSAIHSDTLKIKITPNPYRQNTFGLGYLNIGEKKLISSDVHLNIQKSDNTSFELIQKIYSQGKNEAEATMLAESVVYPLQVSDNTITFPRVIDLSKVEKWRNQFVVLTLKVPEGKMIYFHDNLSPIRDHIEINREVEYPNFESEQIWRMDDAGLVNPEFLRKSSRSDEFKYKDFESLQIEGKMKVTIEKGEEYTISLNGTPRYLDKVDFVQLNKTLTITSQNGYVNAPIRLTITLPQLLLLDVKETDDVKVQGFTQKSMRIKHEGNDEISIIAQLDSLFLKQSGKSKINLKGKGDYMEAHLEKSTMLDADRYSLKSAKIEAGTYAKASVTVSDSLWTTKGVDAKIRVDGSPVLIENSGTGN